ncbi:MAG TPA: zf-HC2 domain-containing protein [Bryobacteraceae bacterium]|jgi:anti-sigma factor RsiW|nr:zf-HC2 domain-containing protein [Bryobacteraceae bacterium]
MTISAHVNEEILGLYLLGDLSVNGAVAVDEHLAWCARCNRKLPRVKEVLEALRQCS